MNLTVLFFARAKELAKTDRAELSVGSAHVETRLHDVRQSIAAQFPFLADMLTRSRLAVNREYATDDTAVREGDEIAVIPPVSGG